MPRQITRIASLLHLRPDDPMAASWWWHGVNGGFGGMHRMALHGRWHSVITGSYLVSQFNGRSPVANLTVRALTDIANSN